MWRAGFNAGDEFFWSDRNRFIPHAGPVEDWPDHLKRIIDEKGVTDIVLYGDVRPVHAAARKAAAVRGLRLHVFEEGYLRPYWISYERGGSNGHSALTRMSIDEMRRTLRHAEEGLERPPTHWGDTRQHKFYGAFYHFLILAANRRYPRFRSHRAITVRREFRLNLRRLLVTPLQSVQRRLAERRLQRGGWPFVLVLMQLEHDASFQAHSDFKRIEDFTDLCLKEFAQNAPCYHHIVFKAHPLEDGRSDIRAAIFRTAERLGIADRVHWVLGGRLSQTMGQCRSVVTVNSTAAQQALWRGLPVKALGRAVYSKPELVSDQSLGDFMRHPKLPDRAAYRDFRDFLLQSSQVPGGYYAQRSRGHALRVVCDMVLADEDPYESLAAGRAALRQQLADQVK
ncbi:capsule biosynthesis protein [Paracoccus albicereus]|uniref:capsule biosynthesis protein n=1 Tax=Paracoccus albicereus TaxID=2922394 RepID=UPI00350E3EDA